MSRPKLRKIRELFLEIEHLRHAIQKLLDQCAHSMTAGSFQFFKEGLQLDVRFFTGHDDDPGHHSTPSIGSSPISTKANPDAMERLHRKIQRLEEELDHLEKKNEELDKQLKEARELAENRGFGSFAARNPQPSVALSTRTSEVQTDPTAHQSADDELRRLFGSTSTSPSHADKDLSPNDAGLSHRQQRARDANLVDRQELQMALDERDLERMKLSAAERRIKELEENKANLVGQLRSREEAADELQQQLEKARQAQLEAAQGASSNETHKAENTKCSDSDAPLGKSPSNSPARQARGMLVPSLGQIAAGPSATAADLECDPGASRDQCGSGTRSNATMKDCTTSMTGVLKALGSEIQADSESVGTLNLQDGPLLVERVDKCVGGGPGPGLAEDPLRCRGHAVKEPKEINKTGRCFMREVRSAPKLSDGELFTAGSCWAKFRVHSAQGSISAV